MAGNNIKVNTDQVGQIASKIEKLNGQLAEELQNGKNAIDSLKNIWTGEAADATVASFSEFASKYFKTYDDIIKQYVSFLRKNVEQGYFDVETANITLADNFK